VVATRALRELDVLLRAQQAAGAAPATDDDPSPEDIDEFRRELARRIDAMVASHQDAARRRAAAEAEAKPAGEPTDCP
jgi:hypothetical protein